MGKFKKFLEGINISNQKFDMSFLDKNILKEIPIKKLISLLNKNLGTNDIIFHNEKVKDLGPNDLTVYGNYAHDIDEESEGDEPSLLIYILHSEDKVLLMDSNISFLKQEIPKVINHESIHMQQARKRWFEYQKLYYSKDHPKAYLSNDDEIEAYANDIAEDLLNKFNKEEAISYLKKTHKTTISNYFNDYIKTFGYDHIVMKKLIKKILLFINTKKGTLP